MSAAGFCSAAFRLHFSRSYTKNSMHVRVLGSAAGGGFPQWNCNCPRCDGQRKGTLRASARTQSSLAISGDGSNWVLLNASPDILKQIRDFPALQPARRARDTGIVGVVLMDAQIDHTTGLLSLREGKVLNLYCTAQVHADLTSANPLLNILGHYCEVRWQRVDPRGAGFSVAGAEHLLFQPLPVSGKAPPYSPHRHDPHEGDNLGLRITDTRSGRTLFYAPGLERIEPPILAAMRDADCLLVDGTCWTDDEMITLGLTQKRARDMGHLPQSGPGGMLEVLAQLPKPRKILIHINNTNPILDEDSPERAELMRHGVEVSYDGMDIQL
jgi:pyrroloquinoline quinone biosynthesis protein B